MTTLVFHKGQLAIDSRVCKVTTTRTGRACVKSIIADDHPKLLDGKNFLANGRKIIAVASVGFLEAANIALGIDEIVANPKLVIDLASPDGRFERAGALELPYAIAVLTEDNLRVIFHTQHEGKWEYGVMTVPLNGFLTMGTGQKYVQSLVERGGAVMSATDLVAYASTHDKMTGGNIRAYRIDEKLFYTTTPHGRKAIHRVVRRLARQGREAGVRVADMKTCTAAEMHCA